MAFASPQKRFSSCGRATGIHLLVRQVVQTLEHQDPKPSSPSGTADVPALTGRGATRSTSAANAAKSMCDSMSASGSPSESIPFAVMLVGETGRSDGYVVSSAGNRDSGRVILPRAGEDEVFRGAQICVDRFAQQGALHKWGFR